MVTKVDLIRKVLELDNTARSVDIAKYCGCSQELVRKVRHGIYFTPRKNAKEAAFARNAELAKRTKRVH